MSSSNTSLRAATVPLYGPRTTRGPRARLPALSPSSIGWYIAAVIAVAFSLLAGDWIAGAAVLILAAGWRGLQFDAAPPVLAVAFSTQWLQINSAIFYEALVGRRIGAMDITDYRPMVWIGLGCLCALLIGLRGGMMCVRSRPVRATGVDAEPFPIAALMPAYVISTPLLGILETLAWNVPAFTQPLLALSTLRYVLLFMIFRQLVFPAFRPVSLLLVLTLEIAIGMTGIFAGFREPVLLAGLALLERFKTKSAAAWFSLAAAAVLLVFLSVLWTGIKGEYRSRYQDLGDSAAARGSLLHELSSRWVTADSASIAVDIDRTVDRMWPMYLPALAVNNVIATGAQPLGGEITWAAVMHVLMPRFLFSEKGTLKSDSEMVREFSGVYVAGEESQTSIAFGYAPELFIDLGIPLMFAPVAVYGCVMGFACAWLLRTIRHRDLGIALVTIIAWLSLYLFERSLVKTLGVGGTLLLYVGGAGLLIDRTLAHLAHHTGRRTGARYKSST